MILQTEEDLITIDGQRFSRSALMEQMERLEESKHFRNSKRYPIFLRFVVEQTLAGKTESLKERTLGVNVFGRPIDYDTNADPIVRVTAGEIRKRIAQYYQEPGHAHELRIDLPLGAYVPHFVGQTLPVPEVGRGSTVQPAERLDGAAELDAAVPVSLDGVSALDAVGAVDAGSALEEVSVSRPIIGPRRRWRLALLTVVCGLLLCGSLALAWGALRSHVPGSGLSSMWRQTLVSPSPVLIVVGVHSLDSRGHEEQIGSHASETEDGPKDMLASMVRSDMVPISDIVSYSRVTDLLTRNAHAYTTIGSADATLDQARNGPVVLIGGLDNLWTLRLTSKLRFRFLEQGQGEGDIVDSEHAGTAWRFNNLQRASGNTHDFAIVASYFDSTIDQPVVIAAGIGKAGTQVAAEFLTNDQDLQGWRREAKLTRSKNVELVLSTEILDGTAGPPHVIASSIW